MTDIYSIFLLKKINFRLIFKYTKMRRVNFRIDTNYLNLLHLLTA